MKPLLLVVLLACGGCSPAPMSAATSAPLAVTGRVLRVVDGDTVHVEIEGQDVASRLLGIDSPETKDRRKPMQCGGAQASEYAHLHLDGEMVVLTGDPTQADTDR